MLLDVFIERPHRPAVAVTYRGVYCFWFKLILTLVSETDSSLSVAVQVFSSPSLTCTSLLPCRTLSYSNSIPRLRPGEGGSRVWLPTESRRDFLSPVSSQTFSHLYHIKRVRGEGTAPHPSHPPHPPPPTSFKKKRAGSKRGTTQEPGPTAVLLWWQRLHSTGTDGIWAALAEGYF